MDTSRKPDNINVCTRMGCVESTKPTLRSWLWSLAVCAGFIGQVVMNILAGEEFGSFGGESNRQLAMEQPTFLTPDGLTFSVWSIIYLFQGLFTVYQVIPCFQNSHAGVSRARFWVVALFLSNCLWLPVFSNRLYWLALLLMLCMDLSLIMIYRMMVINYGAVDLTQGADMIFPSVVLEDRSETSARVGGEKAHGHHAVLHPWPVKLLCFTGFSTNTAWLSVASVVNVLVAAGTEGWRKPYTVSLESAPNGTTGMVQKTVYVNGSPDFVIMAVCLVALLACVMAVRNCDVPYALVIIWALGGVNRAQGHTAMPGFPEQAMSQPIADWAVAMMVVVAIAAVIGLAKAIFESVWASSSAKAQESLTENLSNQNAQSTGTQNNGPSGKLHYTDEQ